MKRINIVVEGSNFYVVPSDIIDITERIINNVIINY